MFGFGRSANPAPRHESAAATKTPGLTAEERLILDGTTATFAGNSDGAEEEERPEAEDTREEWQARLEQRILTERSIYLTASIRYHSEDNSGDVAVIANALARSTSIRALWMDSNNIGEAGAERIAEALRYNATLQVLYLGFNNIGANGVGAIADMLWNNDTLVSLHLYHNNIGNVGAGKCAEALRHNRSLQELDLSVNEIGNSGISKLADALKINTGLLVLKLYKNNASDSGAEKLALSLKENTSLQRLYLGSNSIGNTGAQAFVECIGGGSNSTIRTLDLYGNQNVSHETQTKIRGLIEAPKMQPIWQKLLPEGHVI